MYGAGVSACEESEQKNSNNREDKEVQKVSQEIEVEEDYE